MSILVFISQAQRESDPTPTKEKSLDKVDPDLVVLAKEFRQEGGSSAFTPSNPLLRLVEDRVLIDAVAVDDADVLMTDLEGIGLQDGAVFGRIVSGQLPIDAIDNLDSLESLHSVRPSYAATRSGTATVTREAGQ